MLTLVTSAAAQGARKAEIIEIPNTYGTAEQEGLQGGIWNGKYYILYQDYYEQTPDGRLYGVRGPYYSSNGLDER
jgi:hypothetical protein